MYRQRMSAKSECVVLKRAIHGHGSSENQWHLTYWIDVLIDLVDSREKDRYTHMHTSLFLGTWLDVHKVQAWACFAVLFLCLSSQDMLTGQRLCQSKSHQDSVLSALNQQRKDGLLCDVTLVAGEQKFHAHKAVLAACSDYFRVRLYTLEVLPT